MSRCVPVIIGLLNQHIFTLVSQNEIVPSVFSPQGREEETKSIGQPMRFTCCPISTRCQRKENRGVCADNFVAEQRMAVRCKKTLKLFCIDRWRCRIDQQDRVEWQRIRFNIFAGFLLAERPSNNEFADTCILKG